jgi:hypothetical protein
MSIAYEYEEDTVPVATPPWMPAMPEFAQPEEAPVSGSIDDMWKTVIEPADLYAAYSAKVHVPTLLKADDWSAVTTPTDPKLFSGNLTLLCVPHHRHSNIIPTVISDTGSGTLSAFTLTTCNHNPVTFSTVVGSHAPDPFKDYDQYAKANWDGYGALPITRETIAAARRFVRSMPRAYGAPDIAPGADGAIGLEWFFTNRPIRKLFIDIGPGGVWKGFSRKASGEHKVIPETPMGQHLTHDLARLFKALEA